MDVKDSGIKDGWLTLYREIPDEGDPRQSLDDDSRAHVKKGHTVQAPLLYHEYVSDWFTEQVPYR